MNMAEAARAADIADCGRRLARRHPDWFPAMTAARQSVLAEMLAGLPPVDHHPFQRVLELAARGDHQAVAAAMLLTKWGQLGGQRAWRLAQTMRAGEWEMGAPALAAADLENSAVST